VSKESTVYAIALLTGLCAATLYFFAPFFRYGYDSVNYLEQARSFMAGGVFETVPITLESLENVPVPDKLFPPGYPLLIIISSKLLFVPVEVIAPFLSLAALLLLPVGIVFSFHRIIGLWPSLWIGMLVTLTPTTVIFGSIAYSDTLSLLLVIFSVNRLLVINNKASSWFYLGLLTGFSYLLRNANLALLISIFLYLAWYRVIEPENRKMNIKNTGFWLSGNAVFIVPLFIYNFLIFGKIQPYSMPPSTVGLGKNIHDYFFSQLNTLLAFSKLEILIGKSGYGILLLIAVVVILLYQVVTTWQLWQKIEQKTFFISASYAAIGAAITIIARTKYQWGVHIEPRYTLPYSCFIFVMLVIIFKYALPKNTRYLVLGLAVTLLLFRIYGLQKDVEYRQNRPYDQRVVSVAKQLKNNPDAICSNLHGRVALSNLHLVYRMVCAAPVREMFLSFDHNKFIDESLKGWTDLGAKKGIIVSLFPIGKESDNLPLRQEHLIRLNSLGWQVERNDKENLVLSHEATSL
jgi:hypothetical protein